MVPAQVVWRTDQIPWDRRLHR